MRPSHMVSLKAFKEDLCFTNYLIQKNKNKQNIERYNERYNILNSVNIFMVGAGVVV